MQKYANLVELEKCCQTHILLQNFVLIQPRTSPLKICKILQIIISPQLPGALARETAESLERKQLKATSCVHEAQAKANYDRHVIHLEELFDHHLSVVRNPETLPAELDALVEEAVTRLRSVLHVAGLSG